MTFKPKRTAALVMAVLTAITLTLPALTVRASAASQGELVVPCWYNDVGDFCCGFAPVSRNGQYGLVDTTGREFLMGKYDYIRSFTEAGIAPVGKYIGKSGFWLQYEWGLIDTTGKLVVPFEHNGTLIPFPSGLITWKRDGKYGLLGAGGQVVTPFKYDSIDRFEIDHAVAKIDGKVGLLDANGREVVPCIYDRIVPIGLYADDYHYVQEGMIQVQLNGKYGFVNTAGEQVVPCKYDDVQNFSDGYAAVGIGTGEFYQPSNRPVCLWGMIDATGREVVPCQYDPATDNVGQGFLAVRQNGKYGLVNAENQLIVPYKYDGINTFIDGCAVVYQNDQCGYIDKTGKEIVPCKYDMTFGFSEGLAALWKGDYRGYVDTTGKVVIPFQYVSASDFSEGLAEVYNKDHKAGAIDTTGRVIVPFQYDSIGRFKDGAALATRNGKLGYVNTAGKEIVPCKYDNASFRYGEVAVMVLNGKYGLVNTTTGREITPCAYNNTFRPYGDYMKVNTGSGYGAVYIGPDGAPGAIAYSKPQTIEIDGVPVQFTTYALMDKAGGITNYVKLRDLAYMLNGTAAQFSVEWDGAISLAGGQPYVENGSEMKVPFSGDRAYTANHSPVFVNAHEVYLDAIYLKDDQGNGYTYFKLRDLGQALDFNVSWDPVRGVYLETDKPYDLHG